MRTRQSRGDTRRGTTGNDHIERTIVKYPSLSLCPSHNRPLTAAATRRGAGKFGFHEIWHIFVLVAAGLHWLMMWYYVAPTPLTAGASPPLTAA